MTIVRRLVPALAALLVTLAVVATHGPGREVRPAEATIVAHGPVTYPDENALVPHNGVVHARWTDGDGRTRVGGLYLPDRPDVGTTRTIWVDRDGEPVPPPLTAVDVAVLAAPVLAVAGAAGMIGAWLVTGRRVRGRRC